MRSLNILLMTVLLMGIIGSASALDPSRPHKIAVILVNTNDGHTSGCSASQLYGIVFNGSRSTDMVLKETSLGLTGVYGDVLGPVTVNYADVSCDSYVSSWASEANSILSRSGIDMTQYDSFVYAVPGNTCSFGGRAGVGGNYAYMAQCYRKDVYPYELGHNHGMWHAGTPTYNYGDISDYMGFNSDAFLQQINSIHKSKMNWLTASKYQPVSASGIYEIAPLEVNPASTTLPMALKIMRPNARNYMYLSYRQPIGFDASFATRSDLYKFINGTSIHNDESISGSGGSSDTNLVSTLVDGGIYTDSSNGIVVQQISHSNTSVVLNISVAQVCLRNYPTITLTPSSITSGAGSTVSYQISLKNNDDINRCSGTTTFTLRPTYPTNFSGTLNPTQLTLAPGASGIATLSVTSPNTSYSGNYYTSISVSSNAGTYHSTSATATYTVVAPDYSAPSAPTNLVGSLSIARKTGITSVKLSWGAANDNMKVTGYQIYRGGVQIGTVSGGKRSTATTYSDATIVKGTSYSYYVKAMDAAGNIGPASNTYSITA